MTDAAPSQTVISRSADPVVERNVVLDTAEHAHDLPLCYACVPR